MIADELCALFQTFDLRETKEHERLKAELEGALEKYRGSLPDSVDVMDTGMSVLIGIVGYFSCIWNAL